MSDKEQEEKKDQKTKRQAGIYIGFLDTGISSRIQGIWLHACSCKESTSAFAPKFKCPVRFGEHYFTK